MAYFKAQPYQEFTESLADSLKLITEDTDSKIFVCLGGSDFFVHKAALKLSELWCKKNSTDLDAITNTYEAAEISSEQFLTAINSADMFSPESLVTVKRIEKNQGFPGFLNYMLLMLGLLVLEVTCNLLFIYYASWLGQSVVRDIRIRLFKHILGFKMKYFDEMKYTDMSEILDTSVGALKASYFHATKKIEEFIKHD